MSDDNTRIEAEGACCCGRGCPAAEAQEAALAAAAIGGAEARLRRTMVFLRERKGQRIDMRVIEALLARMRELPTPTEIRQLAELEALIDERERDGMAEA